MEEDNVEKSQPDNEDTLPILRLVSLVRQSAGITRSEYLRADLVWSEIKNTSLHFLRCAALFYHHLV